jgi:hypothetical protein
MGRSRRIGILLAIRRQEMTTEANVIKLNKGYQIIFFKRNVEVCRVNISKTGLNCLSYAAILAQQKEKKNV